MYALAIIREQVMANRRSILGFILAVAVGPLSLLVHAQAGRSSEVLGRADRPRSLYLLAETLLKAGRAKDAIEAIGRLDEISGGDFRTELGMGVLLGRFRSYPAAIQYLRAAVKSDPASEEAKYNLAEVYFESGDYQAALQPLLEISSEGQKRKCA